MSFGIDDGVRHTLEGRPTTGARKMHGATYEEGGLGQFSEPAKTMSSNYRVVLYGTHTESQRIRFLGTGIDIWSRVTGSLRDWAAIQGFGGQGRLQFQSTTAYHRPQRARNGR